MKDSDRDVVWEGWIDASPELPGASFHFWLPLTHLSDDQTRHVLEQARTVIGIYRDTERAVILNGYRGIEKAATERLAGAHEPNAFLVRVPPHPTDPPSHMEDDAGTAIAHALEFANDPDRMIAALWRSVTDGFKWTGFRKEVRLQKPPG